MIYLLYNIIIPAKYREILMAFLGELPFESFEETETGIKAYLKEADQTTSLEQELERLKAEFSFSYTLEKLEPQNWNAVWEANFQPLLVGKFCGIRADFHAEIHEVQHELIINPKMAFGTGHHETTHMMIQMMEALTFDEKKVLDFGCGTGVLAILASKLGALTVEAVDIEQASYENTKENATINQAGNVKAYFGDLNAIKATGFDIILANINRNVILNSLPALYNKLNPAGLLLISGVLIQDMENVFERATQAGFAGGRKQQKGEWACMELLKGRDQGNTYSE